MLNDLPAELLSMIAEGLPIGDLAAFAATNRASANAVRDIATNPTFRPAREHMNARYRRINDEFRRQYASVIDQGYEGMEHLGDIDVVTVANRLTNRIETLLQALETAPTMSIFKQLDLLIKKFERIVANGPRAPRRGFCTIL